MLKSYLFGIMSSVLIALICLLLFTFVCVGNEDPRALTGLFGIAAFALGGVGGALTSAFLCKDGYAAISSATSLTYVLAVLTVSWCSRTESSRPLWQSLLIGLFTAVLSVSVAMLMGNKRSGVKSSKKKLVRRVRIK